MDKFERDHAKYVALMQKRMQDILDSYEREITRLAGAVTTDPGRPFRFADHPALKARYEKLIKDMEAELQQAVESGVKNEWGRADRKNDALAIGVVGSAEKAAARGCLRRNEDALTAFIGRKAAGMTLSDRVWQYTNQYDAQIQAAIDVALIDGKSAAELSRDVRSYLVHPDTLFRRVRDERGVLHLSQNAKAFHPGQGVYRSAYMNARRMAATEINMAYRTSDYMRVQQMDFVVGIEVHLSGNHNCKGIPPGQFFDICDELQGKYPKTFKFVGWHPHCYDDKSEVYTDSGWKLFKDVKDSDLILSLDPKTRNLEYVPILLNISRPHKGKMVHFHNRSYSQLVTPEHEVLYVSKTGNTTFKRVEADKCGKTQPIYRSCEWTGEKKGKMPVGGLEIPFVTFAEFMGYWLADGSLGHKYEVSIAQQDDNRKNIYACIERMGMRPRYNAGKVEFNSRDFYEYLKQFGKAAEKYVPAEIKESAKESICAFLDAFISCDGHIKEPKPFVGNRGSLCMPKEGERLYCTTSRRMADDIGELVLKKGARPSFSVNRMAGKVQRFKNGEYTINNDLIIIRECRSKFATQYSKEYIDYDGIVYDLTLAKNNTMYIRREGKCFWGSNCRCYTTTILKSREEMKEDAKRIKEGKSPSKAENSPQAVTKLPDNFTKWLDDNQQRIATAKRLPYFLKDNGHMEGDVWVPFQKVLPPAKQTLLDLAAQRHAARKPEQIQAIKDAWAKRQQEYDTIRKNAADILDEAKDYGEVDFAVLQKAIKEGNLNKIESMSKALEKIVSEVKKQEQALSDLIPNVHALHKTYKMDELFETYGELDSVMKRWLAKYNYASIDAADIKHLRNKLDFELTSPSASYSNKDIIHKALTEKIRLIDRQIEWNEMVSKAASLKSFKTRSSIYKGYLAKIDESIQRDDLTALKNNIAEAEKQQQKLIAGQAKRGSNTKSALNSEYQGSATGKDITSTVDTTKMVSEDPFNKRMFTNNVARIQGFDAPAKLVTEQEFAILEKTCGEVFYRTVDPAFFKGKNMSGEEFAKQIYLSDKLEMNGPGGRVHGDGIYVATTSWNGHKLVPLTDSRKQYAFSSSAGYGTYGKCKTLEMTWVRKPNIIKATDLYDMWRKLSPAQQQKFGNHMNTYGCALGYDGMYCDGPNYMVIWNRSLIAVKNK